MPLKIYKKYVPNKNHISFISLTCKDINTYEVANCYLSNLDKNT